MAHADPDALALAAYGEPALTADDVDHVSGCAQCRDELHDLRGVVLAARGSASSGTDTAAAGNARLDGHLTPLDGSDEPAPVAPPASVWQAIAAATGVTAVAPAVLAPRPAASLDSNARPDPAADVRARAAVDTGAAAPSTTSHASTDIPAAVRHVDPSPAALDAARPTVDVGEAGRVVPLAGRRRRGDSRPGRRIPWAAAAVAAAVTAAAGVAVGGLLDDDPGSGTVVARADLGPLPGGVSVSGIADVSERDGSRQVTVDLSGLGRTSGYYEVWLLDPEGGLVSLGPLPDTEAGLPVPDGVDLARFSVVDVSDEPLDGDPTHSAESVARGDLVLRS